MAQARGYMGQLMLDFETAFGVNPTTAAGKIMPFNSLELVGSQNLIDPATITGTRNPVEPGKGNLSVSGSMTIPMGLKDIGWWLKGMFGAPTTTGTTNYTHKYKVGNTQPSLVVQKGFTDLGKYMVYNGVKIGTFKLGFGGDAELTASMDLVGATEAINSTTYDAAATSVQLQRLNNFQASIKEGGVSVANILSGEIDLDFGLDSTQYVIGKNGTLGDIPEGIIKVSGNIKALFTDTTLLEKGINNTESSLEVAFTIDANNSLTLSIPELIYERKTPPISGPSGVVVDLNWKGYYTDGADASAMVVTLKNSVATYA